MTTEPSPTSSSDGRGGTALLVIVSVATIVTIIVEALFVKWGSWLLLPLVLLMIVVLAACVVGAVGRLIDGNRSVRQ